MAGLLAPWRDLGSLARSLAYVVLGMPMGTITFGVIVALGTVTLSSLFTVVVAVPFAWATFVAGRGLGALERGRAVALLDVELVDPVPALAASGWFRRLWERVRTRARWRELGYHLLLLPMGVLGYVLVVTAWSAAAAMVVLPFVVGSLPGATAKLWLFELGAGPGAIGVAVLGAAILAILAPWATLGVARLEVGVTRRLIGSLSDAEVASRLARVEAQRAAAVGAAEAERRRIERDLHDGAQQRLVALAATLGSAREVLDADPVAGKALVADAHEEAKAALKEIRDLVRGIHPVILEDRGLDAALSAVVARSSVPVVLDVSLRERPPAEVESAAYFVVSEALANVARHAEASRAHVAIARAGARLVIEVRDDGVGGADASRGTGIQGLRERVQGLGGDLRVISPAGGPTTISVELPCGS